MLTAEADAGRNASQQAPTGNRYRSVSEITNQSPHPFVWTTTSDETLARSLEFVREIRSHDTRYLAAKDSTPTHCAIASLSISRKAVGVLWLDQRHASRPAVLTAYQG